MDREDYGEQITRKPTITEVEVARRKGSAQSVVDQLTKVCLLENSVHDLKIRTHYFYNNHND